MGSRRYPGRRHLSGKQLTAVIGVAGALALAGCGGSSGGSSGGGGGGATQSPTGSATSGKIVWSASPIAGSGATDTRTVLLNAFEKKYPNIHVDVTNIPEEQPPRPETPSKVLPMDEMHDVDGLHALGDLMPEV